MGKIERDEYLTCKVCGSPLCFNDMVKDAYKLSTQFSWMKIQVGIIADMMEKTEPVLSVKLHEIINKADQKLKF